MSDNQSEIFKGLKVLELASVLAGPAVGMFFAELGAEVTKIENPKVGGDVTRKWRSKGENRKGYSAYFASVNWGKNHVMLDYSKPKDLEEVGRLVSESDIVITNFKHGDDLKFGLDYKSLSVLNQKLIYAQLNGFESDPKRPAFDAVLQAETGFMSMNGSSESGPIKMPVALIDVLAAHQMKEAILLALINQSRNGKGAHIEVSLEESALSSLVNQATNWLMNKTIPERLGSLHPNIAPYGDTFRCNDKRSIVLAVGSDAQFKMLGNIIGMSESEILPFLTNPERVKHRLKMQEIISRYIPKLNSDKLMDELLKHKIPAGFIRTLDEVLESKTARSMILKELIQDEETERLSGNAFRISFNSE